jgi:hypothetical protein
MTRRTVTVSFANLVSGGFEQIKAILSRCEEIVHVWIPLKSTKLFLRYKWTYNLSHPLRRFPWPFMEPIGKRGDLYVRLILFEDVN